MMSELLSLLPTQLQELPIVRRGIHRGDVAHDSTTGKGLTAKEGAG